MTQPLPRILLADGPRSAPAPAHLRCARFPFLGTAFALGAGPRPLPLRRSSADLLSPSGCIGARALPASYSAVVMPALWVSSRAFVPGALCLLCSAASPWAFKGAMR